MAHVIRPMNDRDIDGMILNHDGSYNLPRLDNVVSASIVEDLDDNPMVKHSTRIYDAIAYGMMHRLFEVSLVVNRDKSPKDRVIAIKQLIRQAKRVAKNNQVSELYIFTDEPFTKIVRKLGFKPAKGDLSLLDI